MSTTEPRTIIRHDFPSAEWDHFLRSLFSAILASWKGKRPLTIAAFVPLALCALASYMGLGHLLTEERIKAAVARACPPGPKPKEDPQTSLLDVVTWPEDGRPGVFVSLVRLKLGNVRETCGQFVLNLHGCHVPATATAAAIEAGWGVMPESHNNSPGLRFLPPSVIALYLAGNPAALVQQASVEPDHSTVRSFEETWAALGYQYGSDALENVRLGWELANGNMPPPTPLTRIDDDETHSNSVIPHSARTAEIEREELVQPSPFHVAPPAAPDLTIGDFVMLTSGPHRDRIAGVCEVSADKPKVQLVGRAVDVRGAIEVPGDAVEVTGSDPDDVSLRPSALTKRTKKKPRDKVRPSGVEGKARAKDGKRRAT